MVAADFLEEAAIVIVEIEVSKLKTYCKLVGICIASKTNIVNNQGIIFYINLKDNPNFPCTDTVKVLPVSFHLFDVKHRNRQSTLFF